MLLEKRPLNQQVISCLILLEELKSNREKKSNYKERLESKQEK